MVIIALVVYVPMLACVALVRPPGTLHIGDVLALAWGLGAAAVIGAGVVLGSRWSSRHTAWGGRLHNEFHAILGGLDSPRILLLSLLSAGGEEVLFRGVLQPRLGLWVAAVLFAALHFPMRRALVPWTGFAFVLGVVLGVLTQASGSLWPAILLHFLVNYFNLHDLAEHPAAPAPRPGGGDAE
ncbi:MAG TPA: CPBP family intramembrane glutamic endopeptidase [bacterium]|nr:CPBP family intramembrane glutamic endopeptidase [bacterium]